MDVTPAGSVLLPAVRDMLARWDGAVQKATGGVPSAHRVLDIGMAHFMDPALLGAVDARFKAEEPGAAVRPHYMAPFNPSSSLDALVKGSLDAAFMGEREAGVTRALAFLPLCLMHWGFCVASDHRIAALDDVSWSDLDGETVVLFSGVRKPQNRTLNGDAEVLFSRCCPDAVVVYADCLEDAHYIVAHEGAVIHQRQRGGRVSAGVQDARRRGRDVRRRLSR